MKINQIIVESDQLDELGPADIARGLGTVAGKTAQGLGAVAGGVKGAWDAAKSGYQSGKSFVGGQRVGSPSGGVTRTPPQPTGGTAIPSLPTAPAGANNPPRTFADMDDNELENLRKFIDRELTIRRSANAPSSAPSAPGSAPAAPTSTPAGGGSNAAPAPAPAAGGASSGGSTQPTRNQIIQGPDGKPYQWLGSQWAVYNPTTGRAGQVARRDLGAQLTQAVASGQATPYTPPAGGRPAPAGAEQIQFGNLTPGQQAYKKAREDEGVAPDQIKAALDRGAGGGGKRPPLTRTAQRNTIGNTPGFTPDSVMSQVAPKDFEAGQQRRAELDAKNAAAVASRASRRTAQAANEGVYSRFLGRNI